MQMEINSVILFISSNSSACQEPINFCKENNLPARFVRLDTAEQRFRASRGTKFQIIGVPTLVVQYSDGNTQLYSGQRKILSWLSASIPPPQQIMQPVETGMSMSKKKNTPEIVTFEDEMFEDDDDFGITPEQNNIMQNKNGQDNLKKRPINAPGLEMGRTNAKDTMKSVKDVAKEMEKLRDNTVPSANKYH